MDDHPRARLHRRTKATGYRALHLIVRGGGYPIEVQLRTVLQDAWANQVEEDGRQIGIGLKFGAGAAETHAYYAAVSEAFAFVDRGETVPDELATVLNERYAKINGTPEPREVTRQLARMTSSTS